MADDNWLVERIESLVPLTCEERTELLTLGRSDRSYRRGAIVRRERDRASELFMLHTGWLVSFVLLDDGSRQILRIHLPGELIGLSCAAFTEATESLMAITDVRLSSIDKAAFRGLFQRHPRIAGLLFIIAQVEQVALHDRLASLGRTSGKARVAAFMVDMIARLRRIRHINGNSFQLPLTQEEIGDATGLTAVHVNRMFRALVDEGLLARQANRFTILDEQRLAEVANYMNRRAEIDVSWLPPPTG